MKQKISREQFNPEDITQSSNIYLFSFYNYFPTSWFLCFLAGMGIFGCNPDSFPIRDSILPET